MPNEYENITLIKINDIMPNPKNVELDSITSDEAVRLLANTIEKEGLLHPLVVYQLKDKYMLVSGHKRFKALSYLKRDLVPCRVIEKPKSDDEEMIVMLASNQYRTSPEEIETMVKLAEREWETMGKELKQKYSDKYKAAFEEKHKDNPDFIEDRVKFTSSRLSQKCDFIREITGLTKSNTTVKDLLLKIRNEETGANDSIDEELDSVEEETKEQKQEQHKTVSDKKLLNGISTFENLVSDYCENEKADKSVIYELSQVLESLANIKPLIRLTRQ